MEALCHVSAYLLGLRLDCPGQEVVSVESCNAVKPPGYPISEQAQCSEDLRYL